MTRFLTAVAILMSKVCTIAAFSYKMTLGQRIEYPDPSHSATAAISCT